MISESEETDIDEPRPASRSLAGDIALGAIAGAVATAPMTAAMGTIRQLLSPGERQRALPPTEITRELTQDAGIDDLLDEGQQNWLASAAHFGYGAAAGALYAPIALRAPVPPVASGLAFGMLVWSASYMGLLPALHIRQSATEDSTERNTMMIISHVIWGAKLGLLLRTFRRHAP